jgi:hypothetical protein
MDNDIYRYSLPYERNVTIINFTSIHTNIYFRSDRIINEGIGLDYVQRATRRTVPRYTIRDVRKPAPGWVAGHDVHIFRPTLRKNTTTKPKTYLNRNDARRELAPVKVFEPRLKPPLQEQESAVRKRQALQKALLEKTQSQDLKNLERKRARELAQIRDKAEKKKTEQNLQVKLDKLQKQHQVEKQKLTKRIRQDIERVNQVAQQARQKKQEKQVKQVKQKKQKK